MNKYCWLKGTYYVEQHYDLNTLSIEARDETLLKYYQWIHFFLIFQAFLFFMPNLFWSFISHKILDYDLYNIVDAAIKHGAYSYDQNRLIKYICSNMCYERNWLSVDKIEDAKYIKQILNSFDKNTNKVNDNNGYSDNKNKVTKNVNRSFFHHIYKSSLTLTYISIKIIYLLNAFLQIILMNAFLSNDSHEFYGGEILSSILQGKADLIEMSDSKIFPRITICDVKTIEVGTEHVYTLQCVLNNNLFNERIYAFLWFWIFFVIIPFTIVDLLGWLKRFFIVGANYRYKFLKHRIQLYNKITTAREKHLIKVFSEHYVSPDGVFLLKLLEDNSNATSVADLVNLMWTQFKIEQNL